MVETGEVTPEIWKELKQLLTKHRAIESAYDKAMEHAKLAKQHLELFPVTPERESLMAVPDYVLSRQH